MLLNMTVSNERLAEISPYFSGEVLKNYDRAKERIQHPNYKLDLEIARLKRPL